jgi:hypothetical protein
MRRKIAARRQKAALREFVYLDEISVYSLIASRLGPIATEFTETERASLKAEITGVGSGFEVGSQILRKSTVQTTFKEFYDFERHSLGMRPIQEQFDPPEIKSVDDLQKMTSALVAEGWLVDPEKLIRGQLLEVEVQLEAEDIFRVSSVVSAILEIIEGNPEMFGVENSNLAQGKAVGRILEKLLVGLVPVTGQATDYKIVRLGEKEWIAHTKVISRFSKTESLSAHPLYVVGVAEQSLFWKDVRRILFSKARYRVFCRLAQSGITNAWTPVKLAHILDLVKPGLGADVDRLGSFVLASMVNAGATDQSVDRKQLMHTAMVSFAKGLAQAHGHTVSVEELAQAGFPSNDQCNSFGDLEERRKAFNEVAVFISERFELKLDPHDVANRRAIALVDAGMDLSGNPMPLARAETPDPESPTQRRFLDSEFVAIYW